MKKIVGIIVAFGMLAVPVYAAQKTAGPSTNRGKGTTIPPIFSPADDGEDTPVDPSAVEAPAEAQPDAPAAQEVKAPEYGCFERNMDTPLDSNGIPCQFSNQNGPNLVVGVQPIVEPKQKEEVASSTVQSENDLYGVTGLFGLSLGIHRGPRERVSTATQGSSLNLMGGATVGLKKTVGIGLVGIARMEQERGVGAIVFSERGDAYSATLDVAPIITYGNQDQGISAYVYGGPGVNASVTFAEMAVGAGVGYHKDIFGVKYDVLYRAPRESYDQFFQQLQGSVRPAEIISLTLSVHNGIVNPDDGLTTIPDRQKALWNAGGGVGVELHYKDVTFGTTGGVSSSSGPYAVLKISKSFDILP